MITLPIRFAPLRSILVTLFIVSLAGVGVGCDTLDVEDPNAPSTDAVGIRNLASGTEGAMRIDVDIYLQVVSIFGREAYYFEPADPRYTGELYIGPLDPNGFLLTRHWNARYRAIKNASLMLERAPDLEAAERAGTEAFAKTVIGYQLLLALNYLDENGIKIQFSDDITTPFVSKEEAFAEIERYLDEAYDQLQGEATFPFQLTATGFGEFGSPDGFPQFNRALRARVAAYQGKYDEVLTVLQDSFIDPDGDLDVGVYHVYASGLGDRTNPLFEVPTASTVKLRAHPSIKSDAEAGDQRLTTKVLDRTDDGDFNASPQAANGLTSKLVATVYTSSTAPIPLIRNEELLLLRAEANLLKATPDIAAAVDDIDIVRDAADLDGYAGPLTQEAVLDQLLYERRYALFLEGHRWVDLRRFDRLDTLPRDAVGEDPPQQGQIFAQWPRPLDEVPERN